MKGTVQKLQGEGKMDLTLLCGSMGHDQRTALKYYIQHDVETLRKALGTDSDKGIEKVK